MDLQLKNKVSLVCAASEGLGKASALELAREGSRVAICSRSKEKLVSAYSQLKIGSPLNEKNHVGPLIDKDAVNLYLNAIEKAVDEGIVDDKINEYFDRSKMYLESISKNTIKIAITVAV